MSVYFLSAAQVRLVKIGYARDLRLRLQQARVLSPVPLELLLVVAGGRDEERALHAELADCRVRGEWFCDCPRLQATLKRLAPNCIDVRAPKHSCLPYPAMATKKPVANVDTPAGRVISKFGGGDFHEGVALVSDLLGLNATQVRRWTYPKEKNGCDGRVPIKWVHTLIVRARERGIAIESSEFFWNAEEMSKRIAALAEVAA